MVIGIDDGDGHDGDDEDANDDCAIHIMIHQLGGTRGK